MVCNITIQCNNYSLNRQNLLFFCFNLLKSIIKKKKSSYQIKNLLPDERSQFIKGCTSMKLDIRDIKSRLSQNIKIDFETCPVGGYNMHGKVERKTQEVKKLIEKTMLNERLSVIQWETCAAEIANRINDLPLAIGDIVSDFGTIDLITPNRLKLS